METSGPDSIFWLDTTNLYGGDGPINLNVDGGLLNDGGTPALLTVTNTGTQQVTWEPNPSATLNSAYEYIPPYDSNANYNSGLSSPYDGQYFNSDADKNNSSVIGTKKMDFGNGTADKISSEPIEISENRSKEPFGQSVLFLSKHVSATDVETAIKLAGILHNPTEDQKGILDVIKSLLADMGKIQNEQTAKANPELVKAQNDLLQAVANILLAQAVPGLLKQGDIANIRAIFSELDTQKNRVMLEYAKSTKPYYDSLLKDLSRNMAILQLKNILSGNMTKDELDKLPPSELDKILEKIKKLKDKSFEEEYILQQEAKYRKDYLDPNKKKLEDDMKDMMKDFTGKISDVLKNTDKK